MDNKTKKEKVAEILNIIKNICDKGIDKNMDGDLYPHEIVMLTTATIIESAIHEVYFHELLNETDNIKQLDAVHKKIVTYESMLEQQENSNVIKFVNKPRMDN